MGLVPTKIPLKLDSGWPIAKQKIAIKLIRVKNLTPKLLQLEHLAKI